MIHQLADRRLPPLQLAERDEAALAIARHVAVYRCLGHAGKTSDLRVDQSVTDEPKDFHALLHPRMGMRKAFEVQGLTIGFRKR